MQDGRKIGPGRRTIPGLIHGGPSGRYLVGVTPVSYSGLSFVRGGGSSRDVRIPRVVWTEGGEETHVFVYVHT